MDDAAGVRVSERLEHLDGDLDRGAVVELTRRERLAHRATRHVLISDVHMAGVARERVDPLAVGMTKCRGSLGLALGTCGRLSLAPDHLQRDIEAGLLVTRQPDVAHPARAERTHRPVTAEDQLLCERGRPHALRLYVAPRGSPFRPNPYD